MTKLGFYSTLYISKRWVWGFFVGMLVSLDTINISYMGYFFKLNVFLFLLMGLGVLLRDRTLKLPRYFFLVILFVAVSSISAFFSGELFRGALYSVYTFTVLYLLVTFVYVLSKDDPVKFLEGYVSSLVVQVVFSVLFVFSGIHERAQFLYYEPSYFALALTPVFAYCSLRIVNAKYLRASTFVYLFSVLLFFIFSKSANGLLVLFFTFLVSFFLVVFLSGFNRKMHAFFSILLLIVFLAAISIPCLMYLRDYAGDDLLISSLRRLIFSSDTMSFLVDRAGNRLNRFLLAVDVFSNNFILGVGPGNYKNYISNISHFLFDAPPWLNPSGLPAINMYIEVAANTGIFGLLSFVLILVYILFLSVKRSPFPEEYLVVLASVIVFLIVMNFESSYLRLYFWAWVGMLFSFRNNVLLNRLSNEKLSVKGL